MKLDDIKKLHQKKYRQQFGYYLVEGEHLILELERAELEKSVQADTSRLESSKIQLFVTDKYEHWNSPFETRLVSQKHMAQLSDTKSPQGIIAVVPLPKVQSPVKNRSKTERQFTSNTEEICVYLHEVQDPGNLGTILRTLAWFGNFRLLLSPNSVDPYNAKVVRASMGAIFHLPMELDVSVEQLAERFDRLAYLDMAGETVLSETFSDYQCYLFGNEARGVPKEALDKLQATAFHIPGCGAIESLNLASAVNMCSFRLSTKTVA